MALNAIFYFVVSIMDYFVNDTFLVGRRYSWLITLHFILLAPLFLSINLILTYEQYVLKLLGNISGLLSSNSNLSDRVICHLNLVDNFTQFGYLIETLKNKCYTETFWFKLKRFFTESLTEERGLWV